MSFDASFSSPAYFAVQVYGKMEGIGAKLGITKVDNLGNKVEGAEFKCEGYDANDNVLYCNKQKSQELFMFQGLQLPEAFNNLDFNKIIHQSKNIVKWDIENKNNIVGDPVSAKQEKYAQQIAQTLHIDLPQSNTKQAYQDFIREHVEEYNQNRKVPVHYTDEQIARANAVDIVEYARSQGLELKRVGRDYRVSNFQEDS